MNVVANTVFQHPARERVVSPAVKSPSVHNAIAVYRGVVQKGLSLLRSHREADVGHSL